MRPAFPLNKRECGFRATCVREAFEKRQSLRNESMSAEGSINLPGRLTVSETADRLESLLKGKGIKIFARIDQAAEARSAGLSMPETILIIFGDPKSGTPLMVKYPSLALDLPLKALIWQSASDGKVWLTYNTPEYLRARHHMDSAPFGPVAALLERAAR